MTPLEGFGLLVLSIIVFVCAVVFAVLFLRFVLGTSVIIDELRKLNRTVGELRDIQRPRPIKSEQPVPETKSLAINCRHCKREVIQDSLRDGLCASCTEIEQQANQYDALVARRESTVAGRGAIASKTAPSVLAAAFGFAITCACGKKFSAKPEAAGRTGTCPSCGTRVTLPARHAADFARVHVADQNEILGKLAKPSHRNPDSEP